MADDIYAHWRDSALTPLMYKVDARAFFLVVICLLHTTRYTLGGAAVFILFLLVLNYYNISLVACLRLLRTALGGSRKIIIRRR